MSGSQVQGAKAEQHVKRILIAQGWRLLEENWRCRYGEIDLLLTKGTPRKRRILIVEVKARHHAGLDGWGTGAFNSAKRKCLARSVVCWQAANPSIRDSHCIVVLALVALPLHSRAVRWINIEELDGTRYS